MENYFEAGIENLRQKLLVMASHSEKAVNESVQALMQRDHDLALRVKADDDVIDRFEVEIDELAIQLLTKAPLASNLRLVTVAMKISQNLERIGDEATKIAKRARDLAQEPPVKINLDLPRMATLSLAMVKDALDSFVQRDPVAARAIAIRPEIILKWDWTRCGRKFWSWPAVPRPPSTSPCRRSSNATTISPCACARTTRSLTVSRSRLTRWPSCF